MIKNNMELLNRVDKAIKEFDELVIQIDKILEMEKNELESIIYTSDGGDMIVH